MIDRHNESMNFQSYLSEDLDRKTIVICGDNGSGTSYFVDEQCPSNLNFKIVKKEGCDFAHCLISSIFAEYGENFCSYIKISYYEDVTYNLISLDPDSDSEQTLNELACRYRSRNPLTYAANIDSSNKRERTTFPDRLEISLQNLIVDFIKSLDLQYIIYDKFDDPADSYEVKNFISNIETKTNIIITNSLNNYDNYNLIIRIKKFEDENSVYFAELLSSLVYFQSETALNDLADSLCRYVNGSPKGLVLLINSCRDELTTCKNDDEITSVITNKCRFDDSVMSNPINKIIVLLIYFSHSSVQFTLLQRVICSVFFISAEMLLSSINCLCQENYIDSLICSYKLTDKGFTYANLKMLNSTASSQIICSEILSVFNRLNSDEILGNDTLLSIICNVLRFYGCSDPTLAASNQIYIKKYADKFYENNSFKKAAEYYSLCAEQIAFDNYNEALSVAKLLYNEGYYAKCHALLSKQNTSALNGEVLFDHYLLLANCDAFFDNENAIEYYTQAIELDTDRKLIAIAGRFVALGESRNRDIDQLKDDYNQTIDSLKGNMSIGYVSILRNALDFQDNPSAIKTMRKALKIAEEQNYQSEIYKIKQNLALNLIKAQVFDDAEMYLNDVIDYCYKNEQRDLSYPYIDLAVLNIFKYFETNDPKFAASAYDCTMKATDHASTFYSKVLSNLHMLTSLSILYTIDNNRFQISRNRIEAIQQSLFDLITNTHRNDFRVVAKTFLGLIGAARIRREEQKAIEFLQYLCDNYRDAVGKEAVKVNIHIQELCPNQIKRLNESPIDSSCEQFHKETRFEPWMISLTHL